VLAGPPSKPATPVAIPSDNIVLCSPTVFVKSSPTISET